MSEVIWPGKQTRSDSTNLRKSVEDDSEDGLIARRPSQPPEHLDNEGSGEIDESGRHNEAQSGEPGIHLAPGFRRRFKWSAQDDEVLKDEKAAGLTWNQIRQKHFPQYTADACRRRHKTLMQNPNRKPRPRATSISSVSAEETPPPKRQKHELKQPVLDRDAATSHMYNRRFSRRNKLPTAEEEFICKRSNPKTGKSCDQKFYGQSGLTRHIQTVHESRQYDCDHCGKGYTRKYKLAKHIRDVHPEHTMTADFGDAAAGAGEIQESLYSSIPSVSPSPGNDKLPKVLETPRSALDVKTHNSKAEYFAAADVLTGAMATCPFRHFRWHFARTSLDTAQRNLILGSGDVILFSERLADFLDQLLPELPRQPSGMAVVGR